jgi:hypothetical protein
MMVFWRRTDIFAKQLTLTFSLDNDSRERGSGQDGSQNVDPKYWRDTPRCSGAVESLDIPGGTRCNR